MHKPSYQTLSFLGNFEGIGRALDELLRPLEPSLVTSLRLADVELTVGDGGRDEMMLTAFVTVGSPRKH